MYEKINLKIIFLKVFCIVSSLAVLSCQNQPDRIAHPTPVQSPNQNSKSIHYVHPRINGPYHSEPELLEGFGDLKMIDHVLSTGQRHYKIDSVIIDGRIPEESLRLIAKDLRHLETLDLNTAHGDARVLSQVIEWSNAGRSALKDWFEQRVQIILAHDIWKYSGNGFLAYNLFADIFRTQPSSFFREGYVDFSLSSGFIIDYPDGQRPSRGVIKLFPALMSLESNQHQRIQYSLSLLRISVLLHEAMHSLGNHANRSFSMLHSLCPIWLVRDAGLPFCDEFVNGSYHLQDVFLAWAIDQCQSCSENGKNTMRVMRSVVNQRAQALGTARRQADLTPELNP